MVYRMYIGSEKYVFLDKIQIFGSRNWRIIPYFSANEQRERGFGGGSSHAGGGGDRGREGAGSVADRKDTVSICPADAVDDDISFLVEFELSG